MDAVQRFTARSKIKARLEDEDQKKERKEKKKKNFKWKIYLSPFLFLFVCVVGSLHPFRFQQGKYIYISRDNNLTFQLRLIGSRDS